MALERLLHERQSPLLVAGFRDIALEDLALMIDGAPEIYHLAIDLHVHFIEVPLPVAEAPHPVDPLSADIAREKRAEPVPPQPNRLVAGVDAAFEE